MINKVLLLDTSVATLNIGDEIIITSIQKNFPELFDKNYIYSLPTHTLHFSLFQRLLYRKKMKAYSNANQKFLCGTNALYVNMLRPLPGWNINIFNLSLVKGTICLGVGTGVNSTSVNWYTRFLYSQVLSKEYIHSVRDESAKVFLEKLGFKAYNTGCPTLWGLTSDLCARIPNTKSNSVVFTLTCYHPDPIKDKAMIDILKRNYEHLYFWPQTIDDLDYLKTLTDELPFIISPNLFSYDKILDTDIDYVGNRLHGGIRALQHAKRTIIISIDYRADNMSKNYNLPIVRRDNLLEELECKISSRWGTKVEGLDFDLIRQWKSQFLSDF